MTASDTTETEPTPETPSPPPKSPKRHRVKREKRPGPPPERNHFRLLMQTEEGRAKLKSWQAMAAGKRTGRKPGGFDGMTAHAAQVAREKARKEAKIVVNTLVDQGVLASDDETAKEALGVAVEIMRTPAATRERLQAAKVVLEYTKAKPAVKVENKISAAEDLLAAVLKDAGEA